MVNINWNVNIFSWVYCYLWQKEVKFLVQLVCLSVCLSVCVCLFVSNITHKGYKRIAIIFYGVV